MLYRMWDQEPLIPTSYTPKYQQILQSKNFSVQDCLKYIFTPLIPTHKHKPFQPMELLMPLIAYVGLILLFTYFRSPHSTLSTAIFSLSIYIVIIPLITYILCCIGKANLSYLKIFSIISSSLFGDFLALLIPLLVSNEFTVYSHIPFLLAMTVFGGLATARVIMVLVVSLPIPIMRLLIGTIVATINLLFLLYLHFAFMHPTFKYGIGAYKSAY